VCPILNLWIIISSLRGKRNMLITFTISFLWPALFLLATLHIAVPRWIICRNSSVYKSLDNVDKCLVGRCFFQRYFTRTWCTDQGPRIVSHVRNDELVAVAIPGHCRILMIVSYTLEFIVRRKVNGWMNVTWHHSVISTGFQNSPLNTRIVFWTLFWKFAILFIEILRNVNTTNEQRSVAIKSILRNFLIK